MRFAGFIATFAWLLASPSRASDEAYIPAPLAVRSMAVSQLFRLNPAPREAALNPRDPYFVQLSHGAANLWGNDTEHYRIDAEFVDDQMRGGVLLHDRLRFDLGLSQRRFASTGTDSIAIGFHDLMGIQQDGRLDAERGNIRYSIPGYNINFTQRDRNLVFSEQWEAGLTADLGAFFPLPLSLSLYRSEEMARGNPYFTGAIDYGWQLNIAWPEEDWAIYGSLSESLFDQDSESPLRTYHQQWSWTLGAAWLFSANHEFLAQAQVSQPLFRGLGQLSRNSYELHLAYRYRWEKLSFEATLIENVIWSYNSPDWGYSLGISYAR